MFYRKRVGGKSPRGISPSVLLRRIRESSCLFSLSNKRNVKVSLYSALERLYLFRRQSVSLLCKLRLKVAESFFSIVREYIKIVPDKFEFVFTPKHASWLNIIKSFFSKMARSVLRGIRVDSIEN